MQLHSWNLTLGQAASGQDAKEKRFSITARAVTDMAEFVRPTITALLHRLRLETFDYRLPGPHASCTSARLRALGLQVAHAPIALIVDKGSLRAKRRDSDTAATLPISFLRETVSGCQYSSLSLLHFLPSSGGRIPRRDSGSPLPSSLSLSPLLPHCVLSFVLRQSFPPSHSTCMHGRTDGRTGIMTSISWQRRGQIAPVFRSHRLPRL